MTEELNHLLTQIKFTTTYIRNHRDIYPPSVINEYEEQLDELLAEYHYLLSNHIAVNRHL